jgi:urease accessory protein
MSEFPQATSRAEVRVVQSRVAGKSVFHTAYAESPLALSCPKNHGTAAWVYPTVLGPGMLHGDTHAYAYDVAEDATCYVGSVGIARAFAGDTKLEVRATVARGGLLVFAPEPLTGAVSANLMQDARFSLATGASALVIDAVTEGRPATGEKWRFSRLRTKLSVVVDETLVLEEAVDLCPGARDVAGHFGDYGAFAFAIALGPRARHLREAWLGAKPLGTGDLLRVASPFGEDGATIRLAAKNAHALAAQMPFLLGNLDETLGDDPRTRRSW